MITTGSGHNIIDIKNSLINYCLTHDMSRISKMFTDGRYLNIPAPTLDPDRVGLAPTGELRDPHNLYIDHNLYIETLKENLKHHASEEISHNKSKEMLLGLFTFLYPQRARRQNQDPICRPSLRSGRENHSHQLGRRNSRGNRSRHQRSSYNRPG